MDTLDLTGLRCPMPLLRLKVSLQKLDAGTQLQVKTTDPASERDFRLFLQHHGHCLHSVTHADGYLLFHIEKSA